ncbi:MAG: DNA gyrase/topoisomerase IV subunit A, partial [Tunicatimonas sp.]
KYPIRKIEKTADGESTLGGIEIWYDDIVGTLNTDERGRYLGTFEGDDKLMAIFKDGSYELKSYELTNKFDPNQAILLVKFDEKKPISAVYYDGNSKQYYVKRFLVETTTPDRRFSFITDARSSKLLVASTEHQPQIDLTFIREGSRKHEHQTFDLDVLVDIKGWRAQGNRLSKHKVKDVKLLATQTNAALEENGKEANTITSEKDQYKTTGDEVVWDLKGKKNGQSKLFK